MRFASLLVALFGISILAGCVAPAEPRPAGTDAAPCLIVWHTEGNTEVRNEGLELAVWPDGTLLYSPVHTAWGQHMLAGKVASEDLDEVLTRIRNSGFLQQEEDCVVPDSDYATIVVVDGGRRVERSWHEYLMPGFGGDVNTDPDYRAFIRTWKQTRGAIGTLAPVELHRLEEVAGGKDDFRGYVISAPEKTAWRP